jgi:hypothetical protein
MKSRGFKHLLNIDANAKTVKGQKRGYMTAVLYLAPWKVSGINVCPFAEQAGCAATCLNTAGRGGIASKRFRTAAGLMPDNAAQRARIARTRFFHEDRDGFMTLLQREIELFIGRAERKGLTPVVRLNGTSDIVWERIPVRSAYPVASFGATIFDVFPDLQFYDYTKIAKRFGRPRPDNYHLCLSYSLASRKYAETCTRAHEEHGASLIVVVRDDEVKQFHVDLGGIDGDEHDLRFLDPDGSMVYLKAKGRARKETNGFVIN